jgi:hypothetical protein
MGTSKFRQRGASANNKDTPEAAELTELMMRTWAAFARDPKDGLTKLKYLQYQKGKSYWQPPIGNGSYEAWLTHYDRQRHINQVRL